MHKIHRLLREADRYMGDSDDKVLADEPKMLFLLNCGAMLIHHFEEAPGHFRLEVSFRNRRFIATKKDPFLSVPPKNPRRPLQS